MKVNNLKDYPVDLSTIAECKSFNEWVGDDVSKAFYLGFLRQEFYEEMEDVTKTDEGIELLKSIDGAAIKAKPYLKELARLMKPYLESEDGFVILDMVNSVLKQVSLNKEEDIYDVAYILGIYTDYLYNSQAEA